MSDFGFWILDFGLHTAHPSRAKAQRRPGSAHQRFNPKSKIQNPKSTGFTLIEVLIAIGLMMALVGAMFGFFFDMLNTRARTLEHLGRQQAAATLIKLLDADLTCCIIGDSALGAGVAGDEQRLRVLTRSVAVQLAEHGIDEPAVFSDLQFAEYRFDRSSGQIMGRAGALGSNAAPPQERELSSGVINRLRFRYHDGTGWRRSFNSLAAGRLPVAVEVAIWFNAPPASDAAPENGGLGDQKSEVGSQRSEAGDPSAEDDQDLTDAAALQDADAGDRGGGATWGGVAPDRIRVFIIPDAGGEESDKDVPAMPEASPP